MNQKFNDTRDSNKQVTFTCNLCGKKISQQFCVRCDDYFNIGHSSSCVDDKERKKHMLCQQYGRTF